MEIIAYLKSKCERSKGVCSIMEKYSLDYEHQDVTKNEKQLAEMIKKSGQQLAPCVEINGVMLADTSGQEIEKYLLSKNLVKSSILELDAPTGVSSNDEERESVRSRTTRFF